MTTDPATPAHIESIVAAGRSYGISAGIVGEEHCCTLAAEQFFRDELRALTCELERNRQQRTRQADHINSLTKAIEREKSITGRLRQDIAQRDEYARQLRAEISDKKGHIRSLRRERDTLAAALRETTEGDGDERD